MHHPADLTPAYSTARVRSAKSIGHTSVVFKLKLEGDLTAAFKPRSARGPLRYKGEIAAYRLARTLGLDNVPNAMPRSFALSDLLAATGGKESEAGALLTKEAISNEAREVSGALIPWIPHLDFMALEAEPLLSEWKGWVDGSGDIPADKRSLAAQISTLIVFDYLTGNWDRWSGGNIGFDKDRGVLLFIDNDGAFYDVPPPGPLEAQKKRLLALTRFSHRFVDQLRARDPKAIVAAIGHERNSPLLSEKALDGVATRRAVALKIIDDRIKASSEAATLYFE